MKFPKVLVISNNCFSKSNSNGRTLGNFFVNWAKDSLAQFTISMKDPDFDVCKNFFCITDREVLSSVIFGGTKVGRILRESPKFSSITDNASNTKVNKTALKMLLREFVWSCGRWKNVLLSNWIQEFNPDVILLQSGDSSFMINFAYSLAKSRNIPLVVFNTEAYYFYSKNYLPKSSLDFLTYPLLRNFYVRSFRRMIDYAVHSIYCNKLLKEDYDKEFHKSSSVLYTSSALVFEPRPINLKSPRFSYIGNLGLNRPRGLADIAETLRKINHDYVLDIYGNAKPETIDFFEQYSNINYHGFIDYSSAVEVIKKTDILFHTELLNEGQFDLRYAFSTKIADSLASGHNFLLYGSPDIACSQYIRDTGAAWFCSSKSQLIDCISQILSNETLRMEKLETARCIVEKNHRLNKNSQNFKDILIDACKQFNRKTNICRFQ